MEENRISVMLFIFVILLLGFSLFANVFDIFSSIADPLYGEGFGNLCSSPEKCADFCQDSRGICNEYCNENPTNPLCGSLLGGLN